MFSEDELNVENCTSPTDRLTASAPKDAVPARTNPSDSGLNSDQTRYLADDDRVLALPFGALDDGAPSRVLKVAVGGSEKTVFWSRQARSAMAFETSIPLSVEDGRIVDEATGSVWSVEGHAVEGPRTGNRSSRSTKRTWRSCSSGLPSPPTRNCGLPGARKLPALGQDCSSRLPCKCGCTPDIRLIY